MTSQGVSEVSQWLSSGITYEMLLVYASIIGALLIGSRLIKLIIWLFGTTNYVMDMTTKSYCKTVAEIENEWTHSYNKDNKTFGHNNHLNGDNHCDDTVNSSKQISANSDNTTRLLNGWIPILESSKLKPGSVKKVIIFGKDLIVTRSDDGKQVNVLEAYCPHLGAHLGIGGQVKRVNNESCVVCPFHGWTFRAQDGQCVNIPYQHGKKCIPSQARLDNWPCVDVDNFIYMWHHMDGLPPSWYPEPTPQLYDGTWTLAARTYHKANLDMMDVLENGADINHFTEVHEDLFFLGNIEEVTPFRFLTKYIKHTYEPEWKPVLDQNGQQTHKAQLSLKSWVTIFGISLIEFFIVATQIGPATVKIVYTKSLGDGAIIMNSIPVCGRRSKYIQHIYSKNTFYDRLLAKVVLLGEVKMLERDMKIWNHKKQPKNPLLVPEDKTIKQFRRWYNQFLRRKVKICRDPSIFKEHLEDRQNNERTLSKVEF